MATEPEYVYIPIYGVEEYDALDTPSSAQLGGGAKVTNDNLLVSLWSQLEEDQDTGIPVDGQLVKPAYAFGGDWFSQSLGPQPAGQNILNLPNVGWKSDLKSRYAARFFLDMKGKSQVSPPFMAFLKPPAELRQMLVGALSLDDNGNTVYQRPILDNFTWKQDSRGAGLEGELEGVEDVDTAFSSFFSEIPYYIGDGSDGVFPTPMTNLEGVLDSGNAGVQTLLNNLRNGTFSVGCWMFPENPFSSMYHTIEWPHSIGRG
jgi:hypothetical protein